MNRPTISLCLIVRDEAELLPGCLSSARGVVDQIIVVDTGSRDHTVAIAQQAGAQVVHHPWRSDFADARNAALPHATGDWILVLDADERLAPGAGVALREALTVGNFDLGFLPLHNADRLDATPQDVVQGVARRGEPVLLPRLLRRTPDLAWTGVIHENVDTWFSQRGPHRRAVRIGADIVHLGAVPAVMEAKDKTHRNLALLDRACALAPQDPMRRAWLGRELLRAGETVRARAEAEAAWRHCQLALEAGERPAVVMPATLAAFLRLEDQNHAGVLEVVRIAHPHAEGHPNLDILLAVALLHRGDPADLDEAEAALHRARAQDGGLFTAEIMPGATSWAAQTQLGVLQLLRGHPAEALGHFSEALASNPQHLHARLGAGEALIALERPAQALKVLEPALPVGSADGWILAADAALRLRHFEDARALLARGQDDAPSDPRRALRREQVLAALEGQTLLVELTDGPPPTQPQPTAQLLADGEARFAQGDLDGAVDRFVRALSLEPGSADAWTDLGVGLHAAGLPVPAIRALRMAVRLDPSHREALLSLANVSVEQDRPDEAAESFRRLLDHHPDDPIALESLKLMGLQGATASDPTPLISVLLDASREDAATLRGALDRLALQDLHPTLFEVLVVTPAAPAEVRPYGLRTWAPGEQEEAMESARGRWVVLLQATDHPARELLRRHLATQVQTRTPCILQGARGFTEARGKEPLVAAVSSLPVPGAPPSNLSLPQDRADLLAELRWRPDNVDLPVLVRDELRSWRGEAATLDDLLDRQRAIGAAARHAWESDVTTPLPDLPGEPGREESWLGLRLLLEHHEDAAEKAKGLVETALRRSRPVDPTALDLLLQQARRQGMAEASLPAAPVSAAQSNLSSALTSIIIPNLNGMPHIIPCVESLRRNTRGPVELIVVDNGSTDESLAWLRQQEDVHLLEMGENIGAPAARNRGLAAARGETILFCDNDVVFTPGWRPTLLAHLERWPDIGMVGPMSDYVVGRQKLDQHPPRTAPLDELDAFATGFSQQRRGQHTYAHRLILFFILARREVFDVVGGIDEGYGRWGFEDDDLCVRVGLAGYRMRIAADCFIRHLGSQTARSANLDYDRLLLQNWEVFKSKWGLDPSMPYGPYDPGQILAQRFDPAHIFVPFRSDGAPPPSDPIKLIDMR